MSTLKTRVSRFVKLWPVLCAIGVTTLNIDWVVVPALKRAGIGGFNLLGITCFLSTAELIFFYWFLGWLLETIIKTGGVQEDINFGKQIGEELKKGGYLDRIARYFVDKYNGALDKESRIIKILKAGGVFSLFLAGITPEPGSRFIGIVFCRTMHWRNGFYILALGNLLHVCYIVGGWNLLFSMFR